MALFGQKTDTLKVDMIVNNHLRKLLETPVAARTQEAPAPEALFASAEEPSSPAPAASDANVVTYVASSVVVATERGAGARLHRARCRVCHRAARDRGAGASANSHRAPRPSRPPRSASRKANPKLSSPCLEPAAEPVAEPIVAPVIARAIVSTKFETTQAVSEVASSLANDLARCLAGAFQNLQQHISAENQKFNSSLQQQIQRLQSSVEGVANLSQPVAELASAISEQRSANAANLEQYQQLSTAVAAIEQSQTRNNTEIVTLRVEQLEMRATVGTHSEDLKVLSATASETARRVALMSDMLDRQGNVLRQLHQVETKRAAALERAFESLTCTSVQPLLAITA